MFMKSLRVLLSCLLLAGLAQAEGTRLWQQSKYDEFEKGTVRGVAINSDGSLSLAPAFTPLYTSPSTYLWHLACDADGNVYAAAGSPARVYRITPDGKASIIFAPQELSVQALAIDGSGAIYAATSPDGKVYKITYAGRRQVPRNLADLAHATTPTDPTTAPVSSSSPRRNTSGRWHSTSRDACSSAPEIAAKSSASRRTEPAGVFFKSDEAQIRALTV